MIANGHLPSWLDNQTAKALFLEIGEDLLLIQQIKHKEMNQ
ncbi:hypothetical protein [Methanosarcina mazei]|nr:hypothetical protein [Methanosarcina mazei]